MKVEFLERFFPMAVKELQGLAHSLLVSASISYFKACNKMLYSCCSFKMKNFYHQLKNCTVMGTFPEVFFTEIT